MTLDNWNKNWQINSGFLKQNFIMLATFGKKVIWRQQWCCWQCYYGVIKDISDRIFIKATNFILLVIFHESNWSRKPPIGHHRSPLSHQYPKTVNNAIWPSHSSKTFMSVTKHVNILSTKKMSSNQRNGIKCHQNVIKSTKPRRQITQF